VNVTGTLKTVLLVSVMTGKTIFTVLQYVVYKQQVALYCVDM